MEKPSEVRWNSEKNKVIVKQVMKCCDTKINTLPGECPLTGHYLKMEAIH